MKKETIYSLIGGTILSLVMVILQIIILETCKNDFFCLVLGLIPTLPGSILGFIIGQNLIGIPLIITTLIFYFALGALVGFILCKFTNKSQTKKE